MSPLNALIHSFTTISLGGFSSYDASLGHFNSATVELVAICFMLIAGINFSTHFLVWRSRSLMAYARDTEARYFALVIIASVAGIAMLLYGSGTYPDPLTALRYAAFNIISVGTTTGYATADYNLWPVFAPMWVLFLGTFLSCSGSAGGGIKMMRAVILYRQVYREIKSLAHPQAVSPVKVAGQVVADPVVFAVLGFFFVWVALLGVPEQHRPRPAPGRPRDELFGADRFPDLDLRLRNAARPPRTVRAAGGVHAGVLAQITFSSSPP
jgi:trk system potassium uptake protein TrkH